MLLALVVAAAPLQLTVGAQTLLEAPRVSEASSSEPARLAVHLIDGRVLLVALAPGAAVVRYRTAQGKSGSRPIEVRPFDADAKLRARTCAAIDCTNCAPVEEAVVSQVGVLGR